MLARAKALITGCVNPGQQVVFAHLCSRIIEKGCEQEPWHPEQQGEEFVRGDRVGA